MRAILLQHPRSCVMFDYPQTEDTIAAAKQAQIEARVAVLTPEQFMTLEAQEAIERLALKVGYRRLATIVRNLAHIHGEDI